MVIIFASISNKSAVWWETMNYETIRVFEVVLAAMICGMRVVFDNQPWYKIMPAAKSVTMTMDCTTCVAPNPSNNLQLSCLLVGTVFSAAFGVIGWAGTVGFDDLSFPMLINIICNQML